MPSLREIVQLKTSSGDKVTVGNVSVTPQSQALIIRLPFGGFVLNRPVAALVERDGQTERIPIVDPTRMIQLGLIGFSVVVSVVISKLASQGKKD